MTAEERAMDVAQSIDSSCSAKGHSPVDEGQTREWPCACSECWAEALVWARREALEEAAKLADQWWAQYPVDIFPAGGQSIECLSASHGRYVAKNIAKQIRSLSSRDRP